MTCKIIFVQFGTCENYFTRIFLYENLRDEKNTNYGMYMEQDWKLDVNNTFRSGSPCYATVSGSTWSKFTSGVRYLDTMCSAITSPCSKLLREAALLTLKDEGFSISLEPAMRAYFMAERYLERCMRDES